MAEVKTARRYAQAILELGLSHGDLETMRSDLGLLAELWADVDTRAYLEDVRISKQARLDRCRARLGSYVSPRVLNLVLLLIARGKTSLVPYVVRHFAELEREREQTVVAHITSTIELTPDEHDALAVQLAQYTGKEVELVSEIDPAILGGLVVKVEDRLLDLSVAGRLKRMRDQVVGRQAS